MKLRLEILKYGDSSSSNLYMYFFILVTLDWSHRKVYQKFLPSYDIVHWWRQGLFRSQVPCTPSLYHPISNSVSTQSQQPVNRMRPIKSSQLFLWFSSNTQTTGCWLCVDTCLLYTSPSPRDRQKSRMPSSA